MADGPPDRDTQGTDPSLDLGWIARGGKRLTDVYDVGLHSDEHHFVALRREADLVQVWCACGWTSRAGVEDCLDYLDRHIERPATAIG